MKRHLPWTVFGCALALSISPFYSSCSGRGGGGNNRTNFTTFVTGLAATPVDNADPIEIDAREFNFSEDPQAFDALFQ